MTKILKGTWVEIEQVVLRPEERAQTLPEDTKKVPYLMRISGFLDKEADLGDEVSITSIIGRTHSGKLVIVNPSFTHSFGNTVPEILKIGTDAEEL